MNVIMNFMLCLLVNSFLLLLIVIICIPIAIVLSGFVYTYFAIRKEKNGFTDFIDKFINS